VPAVMRLLRIHVGPVIVRLETLGRKDAIGSVRKDSVGSVNARLSTRATVHCHTGILELVAKNVVTTVGVVRRT
jgi:hypothetical protein